MTRTLAVQGESGVDVDPDLRRNADFARAITLSEFGWRNGKALDQADFRDRPPARISAPIIEVGQS